MSVTARHKKPGGFRKLVNSLEETTLEKRGTILRSLADEDLELAQEAEKCIFNFEEFITTNDLVLGEILDNFKYELRTVALALYHADDALMKKFTLNMSKYLLRSFNEELEALEKVLAKEQVGARFRVITRARELERQGRFVLKKYSDKYPDAR
jgi:flagellar motor switch protein FliG